MNERFVIDETTVPGWAKGVRTRFDQARDRWMIVAPERILVPEGPGVEITQLVDGQQSVGHIVATLTDEYDADEEVIKDETIAFLQSLADQGYLTP